MIIRDQEGTVDKIDKESIWINNQLYYTNKVIEYIGSIKTGDKVIYGYDDRNNSIEFIKSTTQKKTDDLVSIMTKINWNLGSLILLKEVELELRTREEYKKLSKRF